jgi:YfiH family protein
MHERLWLELAPGCGISLAAAGNMGASWESDNQNRLALWRALDIDASRVLAGRQTHTRVLAFEDAPSPTPFPCDGRVVPGGSDAVLAVTCADCLPIFLHDEGTGARALVHSGWKGTGIAVEALTQMRRRYGTRCSDVHAILGPCICGACYTVDEERAKAFASICAEAVRKDGEGLYHISLREANERLLRGMGVQKITRSRDCTFEDSRFGSYRREGQSYTRMIAWMRG